MLKRIDIWYVMRYAYSRHC